jgi:hypothetical protein
MDVDDDEGTQRPRRVNDYGVEVDYSLLDDDEKEVMVLVDRREAFLISCDPGPIG